MKALRPKSTTLANLERLPTYLLPVRPSEVHFKPSLRTAAEIADERSVLQSTATVTTAA